MTKKLTTTKLPMELDLDSFLNSDSDSDRDSNSVPHRTLDEILNDSDSDSSTTSPPSIKNHQRRLSDLPHPHNDTVSEASTDSLNGTPSQFIDDKSERSRPTSFAPAKSAASWRSPIPPPPPPSSSVSTSRPLPSLFGGVRSNAKPGAALAAAAAASRSIPTPHAAAIKSRRAKVMDTLESGPQFKPQCWR